jgi:hypothetical protein
MNLFQSVQTLADTAQDLTQAGAQQVNESVAEAQQRVAELSAQVEDLQHQSNQLLQQGFAGLSEALVAIQNSAIELGASGGAIAAALQDLPQTAEALAREMPKIAHRFRYRAGLRVGDAPRSDADVMKLFEKIPGPSKLGEREANIRQFLADKQGSHIISRHQGGSNGADNILWEVGADNLRRGAKVMTGGEQVYIRVYNAIDSIVKNSGTIAKLGLTATGMAILTQAVVTAVSYALDLHRGDITVEEFRDRIVAAAVSAGITTPIFFLILIAVLALFPELTLLLSAPVVVAGFNALFGLGIAIPIIQSLVRHVEAGGFGEEVAAGYQTVMGKPESIGEPIVSEA